MKNQLVQRLPLSAGPKGMLVLALSVLLVSGGCATTFLISKDCNTHFFGDADETMHKMLCSSGEFEKILNDAGLPQEIKTGLHQAQCVERSVKKVRAIYTSLSPEQQENLKSSFRQHGYYINYKPTGNFHVYPYSPNVHFCPQDEGY
jgi:hypothetical protein